MSIRDALPFKMISAVSFRIELLFFKASWPNVPSIVLEPIRALVIFSIIFLEVVMLANPLVNLIEKFEKLERLWGTLFMLVYFSVPVYSPLFCFFRPTTRQFPLLKQQLRLVSGYSERVKFSDFIVYIFIFIGNVLLCVKHDPNQVVLLLIITAPFLVFAFISSRRRYLSMVRGAHLTEKLAPETSTKWPELSNLGSWSGRFANGYIYDVFFVLSIIVSNIIAQ